MDTHTAGEDDETNRRNGTGLANLITTAGYIWGAP